MRALLVHGMGRTPLSMMPLARTLRRAGIEPVQFGYVAAAQTIPSIVRRLRGRLQRMQDQPSVAIGHSLGGVLLRLAIAELPPEVARPVRLILIGSPDRAPRLACRYERRLWYRVLNGDAGALLASSQRMSAIPHLPIPSTVIAGTAGPRGRFSPFGDAVNDGILAVDELRHDGGIEWQTVPVLHPFLPRSREVRNLVRERCDPSISPTAADPSTSRR
jgi:pimeloyl-ACP methyl ester carboxylesterase